MAHEIVPGQPVRKLTDRQSAFIAHYIGDAMMNATRAAIMAGYAPASAFVEGSRLLRNAHIRAAVDEHMDAVSMSGHEALNKLTEIAGAPLHMHQQVLKEYKSADGKITYQTIRQDLSSQVKALELILKARGMLREQLDINVKETRTIVGINIADVTGRTIDSTAQEVADTTDTDTHTEE